MDLDRLNELGFEKTPKWHSVVLMVAFNKWWNIFIGIQCFVTFILCTYIFAHRQTLPEMLIFRYLTDLCYIFEIVCNITYRVNGKIRKLKYVSIRGWIFIFIDVVSVIPFDLIYLCHCTWQNTDKFLEVLFIQNRSLRMYRLFLLEYFYETIARKPYQYVLLSIFQYSLRLVFVGHVFASLWVLIDKSVDCNSLEYNCLVWYELNFIDLVLLNWSGKRETFRKPWERVLVTGAILLGFFIVFSHFYPKIFYFSMQLFYRRALYYEELGKLQLFFRNMVLTSNLEAKILHRFNDVWARGRADPNLLSLLMNVPLGLRKEISADIYWESLRHSELFREVSRNCKRSLSLLMTTEYYHSGEVIYYKGQEKLKMMFLTQGILQIMAEENEEFPVLSFSGGTVFGELSLFFFLQSQAILKCKSYCELQILTARAVVSVLKDYPKDKKLVFHNLHERLSLAKFTQWRKQKFNPVQKSEELSLENFSTEDSMKWLKNQWRSIWESHQRHQEVIKAKEEGTRLQSWRKFLRTEIKIEFISTYLDLVVLSDLFEEKKDIFCLRTTFPWSLNPSTQFLHIWYYVVLTTSLIPALVYPVCTAWTKHFPLPVYHLSYVVTLIFMIDVTFKLLTAIYTKHTIITRFSVVLRRLLQRPTFYFDVIAALPYQLIILFTADVTTAKSYKIGLFLHPTLVKSYVLLTLKVPMGDFVDKITVFKNCLIYCLFLFWAAELMQLIGVRDVANLKHKWIDRFMMNKEKDDNLRKYYVSVFNALVTAMSVPDYLMYFEDTFARISSTIAKYFFFMFLSMFLSECYGVVIVKIYRTETFQVLVKRISKFLENIYISDQVTKRLLKSLKFQWDYDKADYLSSKTTIIKSIPLNLRKQVYLETTCKTIQSCPIFQYESPDFIMEVTEKSYLVAVPRGSVLVTYGHTSHLLIILHRGYAQMNSYLTKDVYAEIGRAIQIGPGYIFPLLSALCSVPCPVSVVTVTDCEVITIQMDDLLNVMFKHNFFKDTLEALSELDIEKQLLDTKPGLLKMSALHGEVERDALKKNFEQRGFCWKCLYSICPKKNLFNRKFFKYWDLVYNIYLILMCFLWPCAFGLLLLYSYILVPVLTGAHSFAILHLLFRFYLAYFNRSGLLVTYPAYTCLNYLKFGFIIDLFRTFPFYPIYLYCFANPHKKPHFTAVLILFVQLFLKMSYVMEFLNNLEHITKSSYFVRLFKMTFGLIMTFNLFVNLMMFLNTNWIYGDPYHVAAFEAKPGRFPENSDLLHKNSPLDHYILITHWMLCCLLTTDYLLHEPSGLQLYFMYVLGFVGTFSAFLLYMWMASNSIFANIRGTIYQEKVFSLISYLKYERTDDELIEYANSYYNYEWSQTHGESLRMLCEHLPTHLYEELVYPIYRPTFSRNKIFEKADEGFFKVLATQVRSVFFNRGSVIMFKKEVQSNIYFVHKGKCFVFDWFLVLDNGSIVGDIHRTGLMQNKVYALTHVEMLKITSDNFFHILNSFYDLEANFLYRVKTTENFLASDVWRTGRQLRPVDSKDVLKAFCLKARDFVSEDESIFEDPKNSATQVLKELKFTTKTKSRRWVIYPGTWKMKAYTALDVFVTMLTLLCLPVFSSFGGLTFTAFAIIGITDILWLVVIILTFVVGITDSQKGDVITDFRLIARNYMTKLNGLALDVLCLIPFELIPVALARGLKEADGNHVSLARIPRYFRGHCFYKFLKSEAESLDNNMYLKQFYVISLFMVFLFVSVSIYIDIATEPTIVAARNHHELKKDQFFAFVIALEYVINFVASANISVIVPNTKRQLYYFNLHSVIYVYLRSVLISKILSLLYVNGVATAYYKSQMLELESYLSEKDTSPSIIKEVLTYRTNLLLLSRSENMPTLLRHAPATIRIMVMRDIYIQHLINCPLFENLERVFLDQLVARAAREFYFPGQKIVEQGDVDHRMYFIHDGEVYIISQTKDKAYVEFIIRILNTGESFGESQGLWFSIPHPYTYRARTLVEMLVIHSDDWMDLRAGFPEIIKKIFQKAKALRYI